MSWTPIMGLRIIAGHLKGKRLHPVPGRMIRPTGNRQRESMFNILSHEVGDAGVLDLFAGTGVLGIEALSRGAKFAVFLDQFKGAISVIKRNIRSCKLEEKAKIIRWNIRYGLSCLKTAPLEFDLVFMDPPYNRGDIRPALENLHKTGRLKVGSTIVIEHSSGEPISVDETDFSLIDQRRYGKTLVTFLDYMV